MPIIATLAHNTWFTKLSSHGIKLVLGKESKKKTPHFFQSQDAIDAIAKVLELSPALEELSLETAGLTK